MMKKTRFTRVLSIGCCIVLIAAIALLAGCNDNTTSTSSDVTLTTQAEITKVGEGNTTFQFAVTNKEGEKTVFEVSTNKDIVGEALLECDLISGEMGDYGLYVKTVNGCTLDFNTDGMYWAFYINGQYAASGVDSTKIVAGDSYEFRAEK